MERYVCIHGHFYQPPRESPWLEEVELQEEAYPYHDWNARITAECYAPNAASRILDSEGSIIDIINIYSKISFDFGPTLLSWLERQKPDVYQSILEADRLSMERFSGHGSAMAQAYSHMIMPLANRRDRHTQVIWGIKDFQSRFRRAPEGMWLPETAVDTETLEVLVTHGIKFTVLSPGQAKKIRRIGEKGGWEDVSRERVDSTRAYLFNLPSGRAINLFFYDGPISQEVSFSGLLKNGENLAKKLVSAFNDHRNWPEIVHIATDGETFGHHHRHGDMALSYGLHYIEANSLAKLTNYGEYLEKHPPTLEVEIFENTSWSCIHGIERWKDDCGCNSGRHPGWSQAWRKPLRDAMDWLRDELIRIYTSEALKYFKDPWNVRNDYIEVILDRSRGNVERFLEKWTVKTFPIEGEIRVLKLLEIQRNAMLMYTSCGWFFDDVSGIETVQVMQYASRAVQYVEELQGVSLESEYLKHLEEVPSNKFGNAVNAYKMLVKPSRSDLLRVGAHFGISSIFEEYPEDVKIFCYSAKSEVYNKIDAGKLKIAIGKSKITSDITWEEKTIVFAVLHLGDHNLNGGAKGFTGDNDFSVMQDEIMDAFKRGDIPEVIRLMDKHFDGSIFSLWHLFKDEQKKVLNQILQLTYEDIETSYRQIYENNYNIMNFFHSLYIRLPRPFIAATEYILNTDLKKIFEAEDLDLEKLEKLIDEAKRWSIKVDMTTIGFVVSSWLESVMEWLNGHPENIDLIEKINNTMELVKPLSLPIDLWKAQNIYFSIGKNFYNTMKKKASGEDNFAKKREEEFLKLGNYLYVKVL